MTTGEDPLRRGSLFQGRVLSIHASRMAPTTNGNGRLQSGNGYFSPTLNRAAVKRRCSFDDSRGVYTGGAGALAVLKYLRYA